MIVYKIKDSKIISISRQDNNYQLLPNEYSSNTWWLKPHFNGSEVVESITQQEIDDRAEQELEQTVTNELEKELRDGIKASMELKVFLQRNLSITQFKNTRVLIRPVFEALRVGDWDIALDEITIIDNANSTAISQKIKTRIENYINQV